MRVVLDTNVLVSALRSADSKPGAIVTAAIAGKVTACYDHRITDEYFTVLKQPKFHFTQWQISSLLDPILRNGLSMIADPLPEASFSDQSDRKFYEVAKCCAAYVVTGNIRHFPADECVLSVSDFYDMLMQ